MMISSKPISGTRKTGTAALALLLASASLMAQMPAPDNPEDIRGAKPLIAIPLPEKPSYTLWIAIAGVLLLAVIAWFIWKSFRTKKHQKSPPEVALAALTELEAERETLDAEAFANRAAQTVRTYISARFGLVAPQRTTEEFLRELSQDEQSPILGEGDHLRTFLKSCDLAKFAGARLDASQRGELVQSARTFVNSTAVPVSKSPSPVVSP
jgi:hypothetical protein